MTTWRPWLRRPYQLCTHNHIKIMNYHGYPARIMQIIRPDTAIVEHYITLFGSDNPAG